MTARLFVSGFGATVAGLVLAGAAAAQMSPDHTPADHTPMPGMGEAGMMAPVMDREIFGHALLDRFEGRSDGRSPELHWSGQAWLGTDYDKLWIKSEGFRRRDGEVEDGRHEFLYDRALTTYFDLQAGLRSDIDSRPIRHWGAFGLQGLAPLFFNVEATGYVSDRGHLAARLEASYDLLLTQRLVLQPEIEFNFYSKSDAARLVGAGLADIDAGLRLRYEVSRKFSPYLGVAYEGQFGQTADFARRAGESTGGVRVTFGIRSWF